MHVLKRLIHVLHFYRALEETIEDFEAIRAMDEEILETQKDAEKDLREELDQVCGRNNEVITASHCRVCANRSETQFFVQKFGVATL